MVHGFLTAGPLLPVATLFRLIFGPYETLRNVHQAARCWPSMISAALVLFGVIGYHPAVGARAPRHRPPRISVIDHPARRARHRLWKPGDRLFSKRSSPRSGTAHALELLFGGEQPDHPGSSTSTGPSTSPRRTCATRCRAVRGRLPVDVLEPVIAKQQADAQPFFWLP